MLLGLPGLPPFVIICQLALMLGAAALVIGWYRTYVMEHHANQAVFNSGKLPAQLPDGLYQGALPPEIPTNTWRGKVFDAAKGTGTNQFTGGQRYPFKFYAAPGLRDQQRTVLRIDYRQPSNPWWLRFVVDEIVQTAPDHFLGKMHVQVLPALTFTLLYFDLTKEQV